MIDVSATQFLENPLVGQAPLVPPRGSVEDRPPKGNIMAVDDQPANLKLLEDMLRKEGYVVRSFPRGRFALAAAAMDPPDLILLDINMPEMNGFELCGHLQSDPKLSRIPVIFLSALNETEDKVKAFQMGGVDYVTKPFQFDEVQARVATQLQLYRLQRAAELYASQLEELVRCRTRELTEAHARLKILDKSKSDFLNLISHEFRTPLVGVLGVGELLLEQMAPGAESEELLGMFEESRRRILTILDDALILTQIEVEAGKFSPKPIRVAAALSSAIEKAAEFARSRNVTLRASPSDAGAILGVPDLFIKALQALLETSVKLSQPGQVVQVNSRVAGETVRIDLEFRGRPIPADVVSKFFDIFSVREVITPGDDLGLGPPVAYRILSLFDGSVQIENLPSGIRITASFKNVN